MGVRFIMLNMTGIFEPIPAKPKPRRPRYVLPKTANRGRLALIVATSTILWTVPFTAAGYVASYYFWPWVIPTIPMVICHVLFALTVGMGLTWGLMSGFRLMSQVVRAGAVAGEVEVVRDSREP